MHRAIEMKYVWIHAMVLLKRTISKVVRSVEIFMSASFPSFLLTRQNGFFARQNQLQSLTAEKECAPKKVYLFPVMNRNKHT